MLDGLFVRLNYRPREKPEVIPAFLSYGQLKYLLRLFNRLSIKSIGVLRIVALSVNFSFSPPKILSSAFRRSHCAPEINRSSLKAFAKGAGAAPR
jgi:hypothetical protein